VRVLLGSTWQQPTTDGFARLLGSTFEVAQEASRTREATNFRDARALVCGRHKGANPCVTYAVIALALGIVPTPEFAQCEDKSQQNAADEAGIKGDLKAASKCATQEDIDRSEKKLENAAERAKDKQNVHSGAANVDSKRDGDQSR
jgi:hypothetical protein